MNRPPETASPPSCPASPASDAAKGGPLRISAPDAGIQHADGILRQSGLSFESLLESQPTPFPIPAGSPAVEWARSGAMALCGDPNGPPEFASGALATAARGAGIALRALAPPGAFADLDAPALLGERAAIAGFTRRGEISCGGAARLLETQRGFIVAHLPRDTDWQSLPAWLETNDDPAWRAPSESNEDARWKQLTALVRERTTETLVERGRLLGLAIASAPAQVPHAVPLFRASQLSERRPPDLHARSDRPDRPGSPESLASGDAAGRPLRLLDLSTLWAGPLATSLLAQCGIEVLKIESPDRPDGARLGPPAFFDLMHGGKAGCALDLKSVQDRSRFEALLERADLVVESARPRALEQLGYDAAGWVSASPGRIWASITGYGRSDPGVAFGDDAAAAAGLAWPLQADGQAPKRPSFCADAIADPLTGIHTAALVLGWLRKGRGGLLDIALRDVAAYAAHASDEGLTAPREQRDEKWRLVLPDDEIAVALPRSRRAQAKAPPLCAPTEDLMRRWTDLC